MGKFKNISRSKIWYLIDPIVGVCATYYFLNPLWAFIVFIGFLMFWLNKAIDKAH